MLSNYPFRSRLQGLQSINLMLLTLLLGLLVPVSVQASSASYLAYTNLFLNSTNNGANPQSALVLGSDGVTLFGTTLSGGTNNLGTIFKVKVDGTGFQTLHQFTGATNDGSLAATGFTGAVPVRNKSGNLGALLMAPNGYLYGMTLNGGGAGLGTLYKIGQDGNDFQVLYSFSSRPLTPIMLARNGAIYGIDTIGELFRLNIDGSGFTVLTNLPGSYTPPPASAWPWSGLMQGADGLLYGTMAINNSSSFLLISVATNGGGFSVLHTFPADGSEGWYPLGTPCQAPNGMLLGTTSQGGSGGNGTIYLVNTNGNNFQVMHNFGDGSTVNEGSDPVSGLVLGADGWLYGTTSGGGGFFSSIYKIKPDGTGYSQLYQFGALSQQDAYGAYGSVTVGSFQGSTGALFGTTRGGGAGGIGAVYSVVVNPPVSITPGTITLPGGNTTVFWPSWAVSYRLQTTTNLVSGPWVTVTNATPVVGATVPASSSSAFYRLVSP